MKIVRWIQSVLAVFKQKQIAGDLPQTAKSIQLQPVESALPAAPPSTQLTIEQQEASSSIQRLADEFVALFNPELVGKPRQEIYEVTIKCEQKLDEIDALLELHPVVTWPERDETAATLARVQLNHQPLYKATHTDSVLVAVVDTETTGLDDHDEPVSVAVVLLDVSGPKGDVIEELGCYYGLREPTTPMNPKALEVHGLSWDKLHGRTLDMHALRKLVDSADLLVAHNAKFDRRMLAKLIPSVVSAEWACSIYTLKFDWAKIATGRSLDAICDALKIERPHPHDAMADCRALIAVLRTRGGSVTRSSTRMARLITNAWAPPP